MQSAVETIVKGLLDSFGFPYESVTHSEIAGQSIFSIKTNAAPALIGARGESLHAVDLLVKRIYEKRLDDARRKAAAEKGEPFTPSAVEERFLIDVNDFQVNRIKELQTKALLMADRARAFQYDVELNPMSAYERLIVHTTLQDALNIKTESAGEGRGRRVVIKYSAE